MHWERDIDALDPQVAWRLLKPLLELLTDPKTLPEQLLEVLLAELRKELQAKSAGVVRQIGHDWIPVAWVGPPQDLCVDLIAESMDQGKRIDQQGWSVIPILTTAGIADAGPHQALLVPQTLLLEQPTPGTDPDDRLVTAMVRLWNSCGLFAERFGEARRRVERLQQMLDVSAQWQQFEDPDSLLEAIAGAATELLEAERASIFLWDRPRKKLIGKPALGVDGSPLEVEDNVGIVGAVLHSGRPRRWQASSDEEAEINRAVDLRLQFVTRSLVAVPLVAQDGKSIGVFEVINKRSGAFDDEDVDSLTRLATHAAAVIHNNHLRCTAIQSRDRLVENVAGEVQVIGESPPMVALRATIKRVAKTDLALLILGENGTGKEVLARSVHFQSGRRSEPFVAVNCAALVESLLESELFGHEKGAFTDAHQTRPGKFELASGGTLFLDEIGDMSLGGQAKLLRVLEEKVIVRVGGSTPIPVDVRVLAATNQPLAEMVREKKFREDLYFRLNVVVMDLPPLRERGDDLLRLADYFLKDFASHIGRQPLKLSESAVQALRQHRWSGNIRELRNVMERVSYLCSGETLEAEDLSFAADPGRIASNGSHLAAESLESVAELGLTEATRRYQIGLIEQAIDTAQGNMTVAAESLGLHRSNLYRKMKQLGIQ